MLTIYQKGTSQFVQVLQALSTTMKMSHEEYVLKKRQEAAEIASGMLDGSIHYLEGAIKLASLRFETEVGEDDGDFLAFSGVSSETDHLPLGSAREFWSAEALERHEHEIQKTIKWAKEVSLFECKSIAERFRA
ncbi:DUF2489 domain-containing protein [Gilvimarinus sp. SDUM040013]|uniref:DUF2489 domain-containing protein n=1 Tax=Gilvimarinus gilvus TaxID=3058038 RepID=A0ABU4S348_9GAMM|nr:DUF2489 domain-containing protein [Gilvimarinus sp. SDUM040013]MDX6851590.1 DUF2489 domain-containing protein [Gilvimarinus sp. SDUM040013]